MGSSRFTYRRRLYRKGVLAVICLAIAAVLPAFAQFAKKRQVSKGPRALGLLELADNGKAHLIPITIMIDGKYYDAGAYKADPVPMALQSETVYEALKSGAPQGLFTVAGALPQKGSWVADGKWQSTAEIEAAKAKDKAQRAKLAQKAPEEVGGGPPKLRRAPGSSDQASSTPQKNAPPATSSQPSSPNAPPSNAPPSSPSKSSPGASSTAGSDTTASSSLPGEIDSPDRPVLRRQAPSETAHEQTKPGNENTNTNEEEPLKGPIQLIPAVSDTDGAEPRPYTYQTKPEEQQKFLKKMLAIASDEVQARAEHLSSESVPATKPGKAGHSSHLGAHLGSHSATAPEFRDVQLRIFDLTSSNEPVLVLNASASIPNSPLNLQYSVALVTREDIYGELHKVFAQTTDNQHLDVLPKYEFIDAVDADGGGRGDLLFRTTSDSGSAFSIYAVIGDRLWPLFEGRAGT